MTISIKKSEKTWISWFSFSIGCVLWCLGEIIWAFYELILMVETPYPSIGDYFWIIGYFFFFYGLLIEIRHGDIQPMKDRINSVLMYSIMIFVIIISFVFRPIAIYPVDEDFTLLQKTASLFYPIGDIALSVASVVLLYAYLHHPQKKVWWYISIGFFLITIGDVIFTILDWESLLGEWPWSDIFYISGYMALGIGCLLYKSILIELKN